MRNLTYILVFFVIFTVFFSCKKDESTADNDISILYKTKSINKLDDDSLATVSFTAYTDWYATIDTLYEDWLSVDITSGVAGHYEMTVYIEENETYEQRKGYVIIHGTNNQNSAAIIQSGKQVIEFRDEKFETYCLDNFDEDESGFLTTSEAHKAKKLECSSLGINDFYGIEFFKNATEMNLSNNNPITLSLAKCISLEKLNVSNCNNLGGLELGDELLNLTEIDCNSCNLASLVVDSCDLLTNIDCSNNDLTSLKLTENKNLQNLKCTGNMNLTTIFVEEDQVIPNVQKDEFTQFVEPSKVINIPDATFKSYLLEQFDKNRDKEISVEEAMDAKEIRCFGTPNTPKNIMSLEGIQYFPNIEYIDCSYTMVDNIDLSSNSRLKNIYCYSTPAENLNISAFSPLIELNCSDSKNLTSLSLNKNNHLETLTASNCNLSTIDFDYCSSLSVIDIKYNKIDRINFQNNVGLNYIDCSHNLIESLSIRNCDSLVFVLCNNNKINNIDIDEEMIYDLNCNNNKISGELDLSKFEKIHTIICDTNEITGIVLADSSFIATVSANCNKITSLDLSNRYTLRYIYAENNLMESINTAGCPKIEKIYLTSNKLKGTVSFKENRQLNHILVEDNPDLETIIAPKGVTPLEIRKDDHTQIEYQ